MINESEGNDEESCDDLEKRQDNLATFMKSLHWKSFLDE
jgi:hypothetical protein